ncbi:hypothetical protein BGW36DRAFT_88280 [Talaromyces proteolyticus]|uniref:Uncharacterized protein n=1 Tax=Talaromyces proteolyticus TaxID=1131652 RepID=A0AAD4L114_9EURO|nr:uncharacterized protein BGW36DRAFT_88280 [Talaromyces proteolyticus]KAH8703545.1 hypothetical protein BGW36DRAFT_88280 [Talaromyces proteolyticus]
MLARSLALLSGGCRFWRQVCLCAFACRAQHRPATDTIPRTATPAHSGCQCIARPALRLICSTTMCDAALPASGSSVRRFLLYVIHQEHITKNRKIARRRRRRHQRHYFLLCFCFCCFWLGHRSNRPARGRNPGRDVPIVLHLTHHERPVADHASPLSSLLHPGWAKLLHAFRPCHWLVAVIRAASMLKAPLLIRVRSDICMRDFLAVR